ncbi:MAG TPA: hypothetical protein VMQ99_07425 [Acetobacteraceae bacterium]|nr:hypothetical protein [Acetobacteraceae bacterium]
MVATGRAGQNVFTALQYRPPEAGNAQAASTAPAPAEAPLLASLMCALFLPA